MTKQKEFICIVCPNSCALGVTYDEETNEIIEVTGAQCPKGNEYAANEIVSPMRTLTTTVKVKNGAVRLTSVRSTQPIPKKLMRDAVKTISAMEAEAPVHVNDVLISNLFHSGADIIISKQVLKS